MCYQVFEAIGNHFKTDHSQRYVRINFLAYHLFIRVLCAVLVVDFVGILSPTFHNASLFTNLLHGDYNTNI